MIRHESNAVTAIEGGRVAGSVSGPSHSHSRRQETMTLQFVRRDDLLAPFHT